MSPANANHLHSQDHRSLCVELFVASIPFQFCLGAILMLGHRDLYKIKKTFLLNTYPHKALGAHDKEKMYEEGEKRTEKEVLGCQISYAHTCEAKTMYIR